jgi:spermidine synthase
VIPLALYLLTFIIAFSKWNVPTTKLGRALPLVVVPLALIMLMEATEPLPLLGGMHLVAFFVAALMCHGQLVKIRPGAKYLTEFYLWISVGGVLGGAFNALISPVLFNTLFEYPLAIVLACVLRPDGDSQAYKLVWQDFAYPAAVGLATVVLSFGAKAMSMPPSIARSAVTVAIPAVMCFLAIDRRVRFALALGALFLVGNELSIGAHGDVLEKARSFFGVHRVVQEDQYHQLLHGSTIHGQQSTAPLLRQEPMTYFHRTSPIGQLFRVFSGPKAKDRIAIVGLGVGALATYGEPGQSITYYEIDPEVARIATDPREFTFLRDSKAKVNIVMGDARLTIADAPPRSYGLIVLDAFSSDAIPVHLLTKDAVATYLQKLEPNGLLAFQISNRYVDMKGVLNDVAASLNLRCLFQDDESDGGKSPVPKAHSRWLLMAHRWEDFGFLAQSKRWEHLPALTNGRVWTDDYSNLAGALLK